MSTVTESAAWTAKDRRHVWHQMSGRPPAGSGPIIIEQGDGAWVTDVDGNRYLDGLSGQWCVNVGYGRRRLAQAAAEQLERLAFHPLTRGHLPAIALSERLELLGGRLREAAAAVADVHAPLAAQAVEIAVAVQVGHPGPVAGRDHERSGGVVARVAAHLMPDVAAILRGPSRTLGDG